MVMREGTGDLSQRLDPASSNDLQHVVNMEKLFNVYAS